MNLKIPSSAFLKRSDILIILGAFAAQNFTKELWEKGDGVMVDRGFIIGDLLEPLGVELIISSFLAGRDQLTTEETLLSQQIAPETIHVERMIQRFKNFHIFDSTIPITMFGRINEIVTVCA